MGGSERLLAAGALALIAAGCASAGREAKPEPLPPRAVSAVQPEPPPPSEPLVANPVPPPTVVILDEGAASGGEPESLAEASRRAKAEREQAPPPVVVITDKNLASFVEGVHLTVAEPAHDAASAEPVPEAAGLDETEWRRRGLEIRQRWKDAVEAVERLEGEAAELRTRFYAADDPYVRDARIKPQWDRVLGELAEARRRAEAGPREVEEFLEEGRRAGALPGWLRSGSELEPVPVVPTVDGAVAIEPEPVPEPSGP